MEISWLQELWAAAGWFSWVALLTATALAVLIFGMTWQRMLENPDGQWTDRPMAVLLSVYVGVLWWLVFAWLAGQPVVGDLLRWGGALVLVVLVGMIVTSYAEHMAYKAHYHGHGTRHVGHH